MLKTASSNTEMAMMVAIIRWFYPLGPLRKPNLRGSQNGTAGSLIRDGYGLAIGLGDIAANASIYKY